MVWLWCSTGRHKNRREKCLMHGTNRTTFLRFVLVDEQWLLPSVVDLLIRGIEP